MNEIDVPQQLTMLPTSAVPLRFRLDADTRRRGRQHIAEIRQMLAQGESARVTDHAGRAA